jgi:hypothetical protein
MELFLGCYDFTEEYLRRVVETTRTKGKMWGSFNTTFLALIPKEYKLTTFEKFIPISLWNCIIKLFQRLYLESWKEFYLIKSLENGLGFYRKGRFMR